MALRVSRIRAGLVLGALIFAAGAIPVASFAQNVQLTPEQQQLLDQLPPEQRRLAQQQLEQLRRSGAGADAMSNALGALSETMPQVDSLRAPPVVEVEELRAEPNTRLIVDFELKEDLDRAQTRAFDRDPALQRVEGSGYYELDESGVLNLPGLPSVSLLGLTAEQIEQRLGAEPALDIFEVAVTILESRTSGAEALEPFGYSVFEAADAQGFEPVMTGPVPPDYVLGPGDTIRIQLYGNQNAIFEYEVTRDGILNVPDLGPITASGLRFSDFREDVNSRVRQMLLGTQASVTMGRLRTIHVFVLGDVIRPGSYVVSSLATVSSALYRSGGISRVGTLRDVHLKRSGATVARLDLYDVLLNGDTSGDQRLQQGDVIFVPPVGPQVTVSGSVRRPAIYELRGRSSVADTIRLAGGLLADADPAAIRIERIAEDRLRQMISVDGSGGQANTTLVRSGDILTVPRILPQLERSVTLVGHVHRPGAYEWRDGMRLTDLISSERELQRGADKGYVLIRREDPQTRRVSAVSANLGDALEQPGSGVDIGLRPRDTVHVFSLAFGRQRVIEPLLEELQLQGRASEPFREVSVSGEVKAPGTYPLEPDMRVSDLLRAGGDLSEEAYALKAELARYLVIDGEYRRTEVFDVNLEAIMAGDGAQDVILRPHDNLRISKIPDWDRLWTVMLEGEIRFPGEYRIRQGETLGQLLERAGGLTEEAFPEGAIFLRESLREREQEQIETLARRLESDLTSLALQDDGSGGMRTLETGQQLLSQLRDTEAVGRLVIDLNQLVASGASDLAVDVEMRDGDRLLVPKQAQEVTVIGETQQNTSHLYRRGLSRDDYIRMSGGLTRRADKKLIYVVRASGAVVTGRRIRWLGRGGDTDIRPGDTIVVPFNTDRIRPLTLWANVTQILYQAAIAVAAVDTFND